VSFQFLIISMFRCQRIRYNNGMTTSGPRARAAVPAAPRTDVELLKAGTSALAGVLPHGWVVQGALDGNTRGDRGVDATIGIRLPSGAKREYQVEMKRALPRRELLTVLERFDAARPRLAEDTDFLLLSRYIAPHLREELRRRQISYIDATGNVFLYSEDPQILVSDRGADTDPWRGPGRPVGTLKGPPAALLVRALADYVTPFTVPQLAKLAGASLGATYRLVELLDSEGLLERERRGNVTDVGWRQLLERWSEDYRFLDSNTTQGFLEPRGINVLQENLRNGTGQRYAVTGSLAAAPYAPYADPRLAMIYADDAPALARELGLRPVDSGANVILASPRSPVVFERTKTVTNITLVAPSQAAVDLLAGPGRNPVEGNALLEWMERNPDEWRQEPTR